MRSDCGDGVTNDSVWPRRRLERRRMDRSTPPGPMPSLRSNIEPFKVMDVMRAAAEREAQGHKIIHMEVGQPGTAAPRLALSAVERAMRGDKLGYSLAMGLPALRDRVAAHYQATHGLTIPVERIVITTGSSSAFLLAFVAALDAGDRILLPTPGYPCYLNVALSLNLAPVFLASGPDNRWTLDTATLAETARTYGAKALLVASPNNPTGTMLSPERMQAVVKACRDAGLWLISDEIYHGLSYGIREQSALAYSNDAIVINSFSKYFSMTGWRIGWMVVPERLVRTVERLAQNFFICAPAVSQHAALGAFEARAELDALRAVYARNRERLVSALPALGFDCSVPSDGAFYLYTNTTKLAESSSAFARRMLIEAGVATTGGADFHMRGNFPVVGGVTAAEDTKRGEQFLRFSYSIREDDVAEAVKRLQAWLQPGR
jgi:aspartate/methionine/tyrosine aminotransferase